MSKYNEEGFDEQGFIRLIQKGSADDTLHEVLSNIVAFSQEHHHNSLDDFAYAVSDMTGIDFEEVIRFCSDEILTRMSQDIKSNLPEITASEEDYRKGFAEEAFLLFAENTWQVNLEDVLHNTLETLYLNDNVSRDQLADSISDITDMSFENVIRFCSDDILTQDSASLKARNARDLGEIEYE